MDAVLEECCFYWLLYTCWSTRWFRSRNLELPQAPNTNNAGYCRGLSINVRSHLRNSHLWGKETLSSNMRFSSHLPASISHLWESPAISAIVRNIAPLSLDS